MEKKRRRKKVDSTSGLEVITKFLKEYIHVSIYFYSVFRMALALLGIVKITRDSLTYKAPPLTLCFKLGFKSNMFKKRSPRNTDSY